MFARFATLFALSLVTFHAQAAHLDKLFDGTAAYCPPVESIKPIAPQTAVVAKLQGQNLQVSLNACDNRQWKQDTSMPVQTYTAPTGQKVEIQYSNFRLFVATEGWSKHKFIELRGFASNPNAQIPLSELDLGSQYVDLSLVAEAVVFVDGVLLEKKNTQWGAHRLHQ